MGPIQGTNAVYKPEYQDYECYTLEHAKSIRDLKTENAELRSDITVVETDIAALETDNILLQNNVTALETENQALQSQVLLLGSAIAPSLVEHVGTGVCTDSTGGIYDRTKSNNGGSTWQTCAKEAVGRECIGFEILEEVDSDVQCVLLFEDGKGVHPGTADFGWLNQNPSPVGPITGADADKFSEHSECYKNNFYSPSP
mmetsp:Transcript_12879/g.26715  ORF Transcript_12879/g.26715 Transcript_12879/m.26715 type:complete len:200 (+) Transcript_12879:587-1186(+)